MTITDRIDGVSASLAFKAPVRVATTSNITLSALQVIDGVTVASGDRVLVKNQTTASANGIYTADTGTWRRARDFDGNRDVAKGTVLLVTDGSTQSNSFWRVATENPIVIGTTSISFVAGVGSDSSSIVFLQAGTGAVSRTLQEKGREVLSIKDFGAVGDGVADDTTAIKNAITYQQASGSSSQSGGGAISLGKQIIYGPPGVYKITGTITPAAATEVNALVIQGENCIFDVSPAVVLFDQIKYHFTMSGVTVRGGAVAVHVETDNIDSTLIDISHCEFHHQTTTAIRAAAGSNSTQLTVHHSKFINTTTTGQIANLLAIDYAHFQDNWFYVNTLGFAAFAISSGNLSLMRNIGVPGADLTAWVEIAGPSTLYAENTRFGAEDGGPSTAIVIVSASADTSNPVNPRGVTIKNSECYSQGPIVQLMAVPNFIDITGCKGFQDTPPILANSAIPAADLQAIGGLHTRFRVEQNSQDYSGYIYPDTSPAAAREGLPLIEQRAYQTPRPRTAALSLQSQTDSVSFGAVVAPSASITVSNVADDRGVSGTKYVSAALNTNVTHEFASALSGFSAGVYTAVFDFEVTNNITARPFFTAGRTRSSRQTFAQGSHTASIPFYHDAGAAQTIGIGLFNLANGSQFTWFRFRVYAGRQVITSSRAEVEGSAAPGSGQWYKGDIVWNTAPAAAGNIGWVCTTAGAPGTWKTFGEIAP